MIVTVKPKRPISGILKNNKWITEDMELDLNLKEIIRCMQFGNVFHNDNLVDFKYLLHLETEILTAPVNENQVEEKIKSEKETESIEEPMYLPFSDEVKIEVVPDAEIDYALNITSIVKDSYVYITAEFTTQYEQLDGMNLYGLFKVINGARPNTMEYKTSNGNWSRFNTKFNINSILKNGDIFEFRILPKNENPIEIKLEIKDSSEVLVSTTKEIDVENL